MRKFLILTVILLTVAWLLSSIIVAQPKMYISGESFDFGYSPQNSKVSHVFWIKSVGSDSLKIIDVKTG
jgi:hypothetical protein